MTKTESQIVNEMFEAAEKAAATNERKKIVLWLRSREAWLRDEIRRGGTCETERQQAEAIAGLIDRGRHEDSVWTHETAAEQWPHGKLVETVPNLEGTKVLLIGGAKATIKRIHVMYEMESGQVVSRNCFTVAPPREPGSEL